MKQYALALDLIDNAQSIKEYEAYHEKIWNEVKQSIIASGIINMQIFRTGNRLFMIIDTTDDFSFERKMQSDASNEKVQAWESLMWSFQQPLPWAKKGEKWILMNKIFDLSDQ